MYYLKVAAVAALALMAARPAAAASFETLEPGWILRARITGEPPVTGKLVRRDARALVIAAGGAERELTLDRLEGLEVRTTHVKRGALMGLVAGMGVGMVIAQRAGSSGWFADGGNLMTIVTSGMAGLSVGAVAGLGVRTWDPVWGVEYR